jgi:AraC-like DNA-binding protein
MAEPPIFLPQMPTFPTLSLTLEELVARLPNSMCPLEGARVNELTVPENIACFQRSMASELNLPNHGRTLHHRYVLMAALRTTVTVCVDDRDITLDPGEGMLILPFQFHHYLQPQREDILWLIVTFEYADSLALEPLRFRPFILTPEIRSLFTDLLVAHANKSDPKPTVLLLALLLARLRVAKLVRARRTAQITPSMVMQVNVLTESSREPLGVKELARKLGISPSHLRARFSASCGVSLGRHLRRLRLEKACGLLRLSTARVSEIAELCSFTSIYTFSRAFQTAYGMSPLAYRRGDRPARSEFRSEAKNGRVKQRASRATSGSSVGAG